MRRNAPREVLRWPEGAILKAEEKRDSVPCVVGDDQIDATIPVDISHGDGRRSCTNRVHRGRGEPPLGEPQVNEQTVALGIDTDHVGRAVTVHIARNQGVRGRTAGHNRRVVERAGVPEDRDRVGRGVRRDDIGPAVTVQIGNCCESASRAGRECAKRLKRTVADAAKHMEVRTLAVRGDDIGPTIAVEVARSDARGPLWRRE